MYTTFRWFLSSYIFIVILSLINDTDHNYRTSEYKYLDLLTTYPEMYLVFNENGSYARSTSDHYELLRTKLSVLYNARTYVLSSGMNAISTLLHVVLDSKPHSKWQLVYANELYTDLPRLFNYFRDTKGITLHSVDITNNDHVTNLLKSFAHRNTILYFETCSNPHGNIFDFDLIVQLKTFNPNLIVIVDNTWVTSSCFNPLNYRADFVVSSLTKYYSNSTAMGGLIASNSSLMDDIWKYIRFHGLHVSPYDCQIVCDNIDTLVPRMTKAYTVMINLFDLLSKDPKFKDITHPCLPSHPCHARYLKYFINPDIGPSVFTMNIKGNAKAIKTLISKFNFIVHKTSFGGFETRYDPWYKGSKAGYTACRISVGYDCQAVDIFQDLIQ